MNKNNDNKIDMGVLSEYFPDKNHIEYLFAKAIIGSFNIAFMNQKTNQFELLTPGELELLKSEGAKGRAIIRSHNLQWKNAWGSITKARELIGNLPNTNNHTAAVLAYTTPLINIQRKAIEKFWLDYDPNTRRPQKKEIVNWLMTEFKLPFSEADTIDKIIRPKIYKAGGIIAREKKSKGKTQKN